MIPAATYTPAVIAGMDDDTLDRVYAYAFDSGNVLDASNLEQEIISRTQNLIGFISGVFGNVKFPLYDQRGHFKQSVMALDSVKVNAAAVGDTIKEYSTSIVVGVVILAVAMVVISSKVKGK